MTWTGGAKTQIDYQTVPAYPRPQLGVVEFGNGVECLIEVVS